MANEALERVRDWLLKELETLQSTGRHYDDSDYIDGQEYEIQKVIDACTQIAVEDKMTIEDKITIDDFKDMVEIDGTTRILLNQQKEFFPAIGQTPEDVSDTDALRFALLFIAFVQYSLKSELLSEQITQALLTLELDPCMVEELFLADIS